MSARKADRSKRRILGRVAREDFVGRAAELHRLVSHPARETEPGGLLLLLAPSAGVSELLRQAYDILFNDRAVTIPIYFAFSRTETTAVSAAIEFLNTFLQQYIGFRRDEPALCQASLTLADLVQLAPAADYEWISRLVESYHKQRFSNDDKALVRFCLSVPQRVPARNGRPYVMLDGVQMAEQLNGAVLLSREVLRTFCGGNQNFVLAGLRRQILDAVLEARCDFEYLDILRLDRLEVDEARVLVERVAQRQQVSTTEETRDLMVQQFECSPLVITTFLQAARDQNISLHSYLNCEKLYADELMGGRLDSIFSLLLEEIAPEPDTRRNLIRMLCEAMVGPDRRASFEAWRKSLRLDTSELENLLHGLHIHELISWDGGFVEVEGGSRVWKDYLRLRYRLDILDEPRALVIAEAITDSLKRAPHTMAQHYRQVSALALRELLNGFDGQLVPRSLLHYEQFRTAYKGANPVEVSAGLDNETDLVRLPQTVHVATCAAFSGQMRQVSDENRCVIAHAFEHGSYTDANQVIWLVVEIESKLEVDAEIATIWCDRLDNLATDLGFGRIQLWLISREGFSTEASKVLGKHGAYGSSFQQIELLSARTGTTSVSRPPADQGANEFLVVIPMGEDNELIAANTAEQIARRLHFRTEAINQIKTAVVEACINASEHSFSPDRKIYQRFRVENDRLVVTISSRGVVPANLKGQDRDIASTEVADERRGWGLKLIKTLMDEVEFEQVDEGTSLKMTKYLR